MTSQVIPVIKPSAFSDHVVSTLSPIPRQVEPVVDVQNCTFAAVREAELRNYIARYVGANSNGSFALSQKIEKEVEFAEDIKTEKKERTEFKMGLGLHEVIFEGHKIKIIYQYVGKPVATFSGVETFEFVVLLIEEREKHLVLQHFCDYIIALNEKIEENTFNIYKYSIDCNCWNRSATKTVRSVESVILHQEVKQALIQDVEDFISPETFRWYKSHGISYKRSYLLHGPPGSGKTSIIQAIAGKFKRNLCFIQPLNPEFTDDVFTACVQCAPKHALIVLEDVDAYFGKNRETLHRSCPLTFSGLLNALDGVGSTDGQIFILTTNFIDRLDEALIRSGRVDKKIQFPAVDPILARDMFLQFYTGEEEAADEFGQHMKALLSSPEIKLCMADLQQHFIHHRKSPPQLASSDISDITGNEYKLLLGNENKKKEEEKEEEPKPEEKKEAKKTDNSYFQTLGNVVGLGVVIGTTVLGAFTLLKVK